MYGADITGGQKAAPTERQPVTSSNIRAIGYDHATNTLEVEFKSGDVYAYAEVPTHAWRALMSADSIGRHLNQHIKPSYTAVRVPADGGDEA